MTVGRPSGSLPVINFTFLWRKLRTFSTKIPPAHYKKKNRILIHSANPQSRLIVISIFAHAVRLYVRLSITFQNLAKQNKFKTMFATGETVGLAEWIIDDTCLVHFSYFSPIDFSWKLPKIFDFHTLRVCHSILFCLTRKFSTKDTAWKLMGVSCAAIVCSSWPTRVGRMVGHYFQV